MKILVMGLPGAGKTYLANALQKELHNKGFTVDWFNADDVRKKFNDWDFSEEGRIRQGQRMSDLASESFADFVICDFVAPLPIMRDIYNPDFLIWIDTITKGRFEDTNKVFVPPERYDVRVTEQDADKWARIIYEHLSHKI